MQGAYEHTSVQVLSTGGPRVPARQGHREEHGAHHTELGPAEAGGGAQSRDRRVRSAEGQP